MGHASSPLSALLSKGNKRLTTSFLSHFGTFSFLSKLVKRKRYLNGKVKTSLMKAKFLNLKTFQKIAILASSKVSVKSSCLSQDPKR